MVLLTDNKILSRKLFGFHNYKDTDDALYYTEGCLLATKIINEGLHQQFRVFCPKHSIVSTIECNFKISSAMYRKKLILDGLIVSL